MAIQYSSRANPREDLKDALGEYNTSEFSFIARDVLPVRPVKVKAASLSVLTRENLKRADTQHANGAAFGRVTLSAEDTTYACVDYGLEDQLTDDDRKNYETDFDAELETVQLVQDKIDIEQEVRVATAIFNTSTWTGASLYTDVSSAPWDAAASPIIAHIQAAKEKVRKGCGMIPTTMVVGATTLNNILMNTGIINRFPGATLITEQMIRANLAAIFGLDELLVGNAVYDTAKEGQSFVAGDVWSDDYAMIMKPNKGSLKSGGVGRTVVWDTFDGLGVVSYREEQTESDIFRVRQYQQEKIFDASCGHLLKVDA